MNYTVVSSAEFTYPDIRDYQSASSSIDTFSARGSYGCFQVLFSELNRPELEIHFENLPDGTVPEIYSLLSVPVESHPRMSMDNVAAHYPERIAPFRVYDCLRPYDGRLDLLESCGGVYISVKVEKSAEPGIYSCTMIAGDLRIPMKLEIYSATVPEETLTMINGFIPEKVCEYHHVEYGSPAYIELEAKYLAQLRRMHQNMVYAYGITYKAVGENKYEFDFTQFTDMVKRFEKAGMTRFSAPAVGFRKSWDASTILVGGSIPAMSYEGYCYLLQYLPALKKVLDENGWTDRFVMGCADEPNAENSTEYRALCGMIHRIVPEFRLCEAMSFSEAAFASADILVLLNTEYEKHIEEIEINRLIGGENWHYVCCEPRQAGCVNRFMDYPLIATRYLHWGNYKYNLTGYLHWAANHYQPGQNPFEQSCPEHHNADRVTFLPAGDTHIMYPAEGEPWMSIRLEAQRESAEDYEFFRMLSKIDQQKADEICGSVFHSFSDIEYDVKKFTDAKRRLLESLSC